MQLPLLYLLLVLCFMNAKSINICDTYEINRSKKCYVKETLTKISHCPTQMAVDIKTNTLYFNIDLGEDFYIPAFFNLNTKETGQLRGIRSSFALASDTKKSNIYFGGNRGIYKYNTISKQLKLLNIPNLDIWWLYVNKYLYFIKFPSLLAYRYLNKTIQPVQELNNKIVYKFIIDSRNNVFFINATGLYTIMRNSEAAILLSDNNNYYYSGIVIDNNDAVYAYNEDGIFALSRVKLELVKVINVTNIAAMTFDAANNIIYCDFKEIVLLKPVKNKI